MNWLLVVINLIVLVNSIAAIARQEKIIKKPLGLKPTKSPKTIIDEFRNLSPEDFEFLKQVDKQFKVHGEKIRIKVERENNTVVNKNSKRTIDDSLGYGYRQNQHNNGYHFSQPHYMQQFTPHDAANEKGAYREKATDIEIQQSHSFELKEQDYPVAHTYQPSTASQSQYQQEQVYEDPVPVIVLRVPGPQKYALHLQALLQQYLEIRAAQYIKALEDQERHGYLMHPQHYVAQQNLQHMQYVQMYAMTPMYRQQQHQQHHQQEQQQHQQQNYYQQQMHHQPPHNRYGHSNSYYYEQSNIGHQDHVSPGEQSYYSHSQSNHPPTTEYHAPTPSHQQEFPTSYINFVTPAYEKGDIQNHQMHHQPHHDDSLETSENYPSDKHTHVIFKKKKNRIRPTHSYQHSLPIVVPEPQMSHHEEGHEEHHQHDEYQHNPEIIVTQRTKAPFNYHVLPTLAPTDEELHERHNPKRMAPFTKDQFEKARRIMMKVKRNRGSMKQSVDKSMEDVKSS